MNDEDFIEDSYLDASAENGSHTLSPQPSSYFAIDSDNGSDEGNLPFLQYKEYFSVTTDKNGNFDLYSMNTLILYEKSVS